MQHSSTDRASRTTAKTAATNVQPDAVDLLVADHEKVKALFKQYQQLAEAGSPAKREKRELAMQICNELTVHTQIEEQLFYPAVRQALGEEDMIDEAVVEHDTAKYLIKQLQKGEPGDELYDAKVQVLGEYIEHHVKEEEEEMFPMVEKSKIDTQALGAAMLKRKEQLLKKLVH